MPASFGDDERLSSNELAGRSVGDAALVAATVRPAQVAQRQHGAVRRQHVTEIVAHRATVLVPRDHVAGLPPRRTVELQVLALGRAVVRRRRRIICTTTADEHRQLLHASVTA